MLRNLYFISKIRGVYVKGFLVRLGKIVKEIIWKIIFVLYKNKGFFFFYFLMSNVEIELDKYCCGRGWFMLKVGLFSVFFGYCWRRVNLVLVWFFYYYFVDKIGKIK